MTRLMWMPERAVDLLAARMDAEGDTPAKALARLVGEDGPAPVVEWRDAVYEPSRTRDSSLLERLRDRLDPTWRRMLWWSAGRRQPRQYSTAPVRLEGEAAKRVEEILARQA